MIYPPYKDSVFLIKVKPVYKGNTRDLTKLAFIDRWPLYRG